VVDGGESGAVGESEVVDVGGELGGSWLVGGDVVVATGGLGLS
jgi:hypothetical protein